jgi:hypothetical protein
MIAPFWPTAVHLVAWEQLTESRLPATDVADHDVPPFAVERIVFVPTAMQCWASAQLTPTRLPL